MALRTASLRHQALPLARTFASSSRLAVARGPDHTNPQAVTQERARASENPDGGQTQREVAHVGDAPSRADINAAQASTVYGTSLVGSGHSKGELTHTVDEDYIPAGVVSGAPPEMLERRVRIYRPTPSTMQSAKATSHHWRVDWDTLPGASKFENPLMGWAASADYVQGTHVKFRTKEDAIAYVERQGYPYFVQEPPEPKFKPKSYANNYLYNPGPLRIVRTK